MKKGFTLIEMMIVVAIIAIIAAIAIPSLLAARRSALETNATGSCRSYAGAQVIFKRNDWDGDGIMSYACPVGLLPAGAPAVAAPVAPEPVAAGVTSFYLLNAMPDGAGIPIQLLDRAFALANAVVSAKHGYWFQDIETIGGAAGVDLLAAEGWVNDYSITAIPAVYGRTGYRTFIVSTNGTTFGLDRGNVDTPVPVTDYPSSPQADGWVVTE